MRPLLHNLRLRTKIIVLVTVVMISGLAISTYIGQFITRLLVEENQYNRAVELVYANADRFAKRDVHLDAVALTQEFQIMKHDHQDVLEISVYSHLPEGTHSLVLSTNPNAPLMELDAQADIKQMFEYYSPFSGVQSIETGSEKSLAWIVGAQITEQGTSVGCLNLKVSKSRINDISKKLIQYNGQVMLGTVIGIILLLSIAFSRLVNQPIERILGAMEQAEAGDLEKRVDVHRQDELGIIATRFNRMMDRVKALNEGLSTRVAEATEELQQRNIELTRINEELFETQRRLARSERLAIAGQLAASLAHEIGTPLNAISGHVQLLTRAIPAGDEATRKRLKIIETQIDNIVRVVKDLLTSTRDTTLNRVPTDLKSFLEEVMLFAKPTLDIKRIRIRTEFDPHLPPLPIDSLKMNQVFLNLINNSIDAMPNGGNIRLRTFLSPAEGENPRACIEFSDTGVGISKEHLSRIFEPTFTTKRVGSGTGLGLAISKQIIKAHGGTIGAESPESGGARFTVELPLTEKESSHAHTLEHTDR
jgi:signal transduction histidine kinase